MKIYKREFHYDRRPVWVPVTLEDGRPLQAASLEEAAQLVAAMRGDVYYLRHGEYSAPDFGVRDESGRIRPLDL